MIYPEQILGWVVCIIALVSCQKQPDGSGSPSADGIDQRAASPTDIVAKVDGVPILARDIKNLTEIPDSGIDKDEALEILIRNQLLANEAKARGYGTFSTVADTRKNSLARALLKKRIGQEIRTQNLDDDKLRQLYEADKNRFVHGQKIRVDQIVVLSNKKGLSPEAASKIAEKIAGDAQRQGISTEEDFIRFAQEAAELHGQDKVKLERLPPFTKDTKRFVREFVEPSFKIEKVDTISPVIQTKFGCHLIYLAERLPPQNLSFDEARETIAEEWLPQEQKKKSEQLLQTLNELGDIFIHEETVNNMDWPQ